MSKSLPAPNRRAGGVLALSRYGGAMAIPQAGQTSMICRPVLRHSRAKASSL